MREAIQKSIEGGYPKHRDPYYSYEQRLSDCWVDPLFWSCLGKSLGWSAYIYKNGEMLEGSWLWYWHKFIDHLAEGKDPEEFFNNLLK